MQVWAPPIWMRPQLPQEAGGDDEFEALRGTLTTNEWDINNQLTTHCQPICCSLMGPWLRSSWHCTLNPKYTNISNLWSSANMLFVYDNAVQWWLWRWWWQWGAGGIVHKQAKWSQALSTSRVTKQWPLQLSASFRNCFIAFACLATRGQFFAPFFLLQWKTTIARMTKKGQLWVALGESAYSSWVCSLSILGLLPLAYIRHASCQCPMAALQKGANIVDWGLCK